MKVPDTLSACEHLLEMVTTELKTLTTLRGKLWDRIALLKSGVPTKSEPARTASAGGDKVRSSKDDPPKA